MSDDEQVGTAVIRLRVDRDEADEEIRKANEDYDRQGTDRARTRGKNQGDAEGDAFTRALRTKLEAALKQLPKQTDIRLNADTSEASQRLLQVQAELKELTEKEIGVKISEEDAQRKIAELSAELKSLTRDKNIRVRVDAAAAYAELAALNAQLDLVGPKAAKAGRDGGEGLHPLLTAIITLGPPLIPLTSGLLGAASAAVGLGAAGVIAIKGITNEVEKGTKLGNDYATTFKGLSTNFTVLQHTAANGLFPGFDDATSKLRRELPELNIELAQSSIHLGSIADHLIGGVISGFETFNPLINKAEILVDNLAGRFEKWSAGGGGTHFMETLSADMDIAVPAIGSLVTTVAHLVEAFHPIGTTTLTEITAFTSVINKIPVGVLQAGATALVVFKTAAIASAGLTAASKALEGYAAAETAAAVAAGRMTEAQAAATAATGARGFAGTLGLGLARLTPYVAAAIGAEFAIKAASDATESWRTSQDGLTASTGQVIGVLDKWRHLDIGGGADVIRQAKAARAEIAQAQADLNSISGSATIARIAPDEKQYEKDKRTFDQYNKEYFALADAAEAAQQAAAAANYHNTALNEQAQAAATEAYAAEVKLLQVRSRLKAAGEDEGGPAAIGQGVVAAMYREQTDAANAYSLAVDRVNQKNYAALAAQNDSNGAISASLKAYDGLEGQVQKNIDVEKRWTATKKNQTVTVDGVKYSIDAYNRALDMSDGNIYKAKGLLQGHTIALQADKEMLARLQNEQENVNNAYAQSAVDLKLTNDQLDLFSSAIGIATSDLASGRITADEFEKAMGSVKDRLLNANTANAAWLASIDQFNKSGKTAADVAMLIGAALKAGRGYLLDYTGANLSAVTAADAAAQAVKENSKSIGENGELLGQLTKTSKGWIVTQPQLAQGSLAIAQALQQQATAAQDAAEQTYQNEAATKGSKVAAQDALGVYKGYRQELINQITQLTGNSKAAQGLADKYLAIPDNVDTFIKQIGAKDVGTAIGGLTTAINKLDKDIRISLGLDDSDFVYRINADQLRLDNLARGGRFTAGVQANGSVLDFYASGGFDNGPAKVSHFANGAENHVAQIAPAGAWRVWAEAETGGESYIPLAPEKRSRSVEIWAETGKRLGVMDAHVEGGTTRGVAAAVVTARNPQIDELIAALYDYLSQPVPVVLEAQGTQLARVVNDQNQRIGRRN